LGHGAWQFAGSSGVDRQAGSRQGTEILESVLDRLSQCAHLGMVGLRGGVENDEESEQQGNKVGVRHQPTI
jgi:hypothetical protein